MKTKHCNKCDETKDVADFGKDKNKNDGLTNYCKSCRAARQREWAFNNPDKVKKSNEKYAPKRKEYYDDPDNKLKYRKKFIERTFKMDYSEYERMQEEQSNLCAICEKPESGTRVEYLAVDHDHSSGNIRGLLCNLCNRALGYFQDDLEVLQNAITYLLKHKNVKQ